MKSYSGRSIFSKRSRRHENAERRTDYWLSHILLRKKRRSSSSNSRPGRKNSARSVNGCCGSPSNGSSLSIFYGPMDLGFESTILCASEKHSAKPCVMSVNYGAAAVNGIADAVVSHARHHLLLDGSVRRRRLLRIVRSTAAVVFAIGVFTSLMRAS